MGEQDATELRQLLATPEDGFGRIAAPSARGTGCPRERSRTSVQRHSCRALRPRLGQLPEECRRVAPVDRQRDAPTEIALDVAPDLAGIELEARLGVQLDGPMRVALEIAAALEAQDGAGEDPEVPVIDAEPHEQEGRVDEGVEHLVDRRRPVPVAEAEELQQVVLAQDDRSPGIQLPEQAVDKGSLHRPSGLCGVARGHTTPIDSRSAGPSK